MADFLYIPQHVIDAEIEANLKAEIVFRMSRDTYSEELRWSRTPLGELSYRCKYLIAIGDVELASEAAKKLATMTYDEHMDRRRDPDTGGVYFYEWPREY